MSSSDRRAVLAGLGALALAGGCGFRPAYAPGGAGRSLQGQVRAADPVSRADFQFLTAFEDRLGRPAAPRFELAYRIAVDRTDAGRIQGQGATRVLLAGRLDYDLTESGRSLAQGRVSAETAFSTTATQLAAQTAAEDAELRLMRMLADGLIDRLLADPTLAGA